MTAQTCPRCGLLNPETAETCDCGYDFRTGVKGPARFSVSRSFWSLRVETPDEARQAIRDSAYTFYAVALIQALAAFAIGPASLVDAVIFAALAFFLQKRKSNAPAVLLLVFSIVSVAVIARNWGTGAPGGRNIVLGIVLVWAALKALVATSKFKP
jgi:hypothetical protein